MFIFSGEPSRTLILNPSDVDFIFAACKRFFFVLPPIPLFCANRSRDSQEYHPPISYVLYLTRSPISTGLHFEHTITASLGRCSSWQLTDQGGCECSVLASISVTSTAWMWSLTNVTSLPNNDNCVLSDPKWLDFLGHIVRSLICSKTLG